MGERLTELRDVAQRRLELRDVALEERAGAGSVPASTVCVRYLGRVDYGDALSLQERLVAARIAGEVDDHLLLLEHDPVYTLGRGADEADLLGMREKGSVPVWRVGRGGGVTFHGPGQLVGYPIVRLRPSRDVHRFIRTLELSLIETCAAFGVVASVRPGPAGVWVGEAKIASIGIGVRRGITYHGVALNVRTDLSYFERVVPCKTPGMRMTTLERELGTAPALEVVAGRFARSLTLLLGTRASREAMT